MGSWDILVVVVRFWYLCERGFGVCGLYDVLFCV